MEDYATMTVKELEIEHFKECLKLNGLINCDAETFIINHQKQLVDKIYKQLYLAYKKASDIQFKGGYIMAFNPIAIEIEDKEKWRNINMTKVKDMTTQQLEDICYKHDICKDCPLLLNVFVEDDDTYDYHTKVVCYKKYVERIKKIEEKELEV